MVPVILCALGVHFVSFVVMKKKQLTTKNTKDITKDTKEKILLKECSCTQNYRKGLAIKTAYFIYFHADSQISRLENLCHFVSNVFCKFRK